MGKSKILDYIVLGVLFIFLTVALVLVPSEKTIGFWIAYGFTALTFVALFFIVNKSNGRAHFISTRFLGLPILQLAMLYAVAQILLLAVLAVMPSFPLWGAILACVLILLFFGYFILTADYEASATEDLDELANSHGDRKKAFSLDVIYDDVKKCAEETSSDETREKLRELCKKINLSSNVRSAETKTIEKRILSKVEALKKATDKNILIDELSDLIDERNEICEKL